MLYCLLYSVFLHAPLPLPLVCCVQVSYLIFELHAFWCEDNHRVKEKSVLEELSEGDLV